MSAFKYIDTHSHLHFKQYDNDRADVLARMRERGVVTIAVGTSVDTSAGAIALAKEQPELVVGATIGVHPTDTDEGFDTKAYELFVKEDVVVGVGECGLDYFRGDRSVLKPRQEQAFDAQIVFAVEHSLPLMLHVRPSKGSEDAHEDALAMLRAAQKVHGEKVRGNAHFFTASLAIAKQYWDIGITVAIPGVVTFAPEMVEVVREAPLNMILSETDAPYAAPEPYRGGRNEPTYVIEIVDYIANIRREDEQVVREQLVSNACRVFGIEGSIDCIT
jgi:TatD DNase family protein